jgi:hypothetical protein
VGNHLRSFQVFVVTIADILLWLGNAPALLLVDGANNLDQLTFESSRKATEFVEFVDGILLTPTGHYFAFSADILSTRSVLGVVGCPKRNSQSLVTRAERAATMTRLDLTTHQLVGASIADEQAFDKCIYSICGTRIFKVCTDCTRISISLRQSPFMENDE